MNKEPLNYQSDAAPVSKKFVDQKDSKRRRAEKYRERSHQNPSIKRNGLIAECEDDDEPVKAEIPRIEKENKQYPKSVRHEKVQKAPIPPTPRKTKRKPLVNNPIPSENTQE